MKPIWYFIGIILMIFGFLITVTGIYEYVNPPDRQTVLSNIHPSIWWGALMILVGILFYIKNKNVVVRE
jgi:amino acid transporter